MSASFVVWLLPCVLLISGCGRTEDEQQKLSVMATELFSRANATDIVVAFSSVMDEERYRFVLNALNHRLGRRVTLFTGEESARLLRSLRDREAVHHIVLVDSAIGRLTSLRNPLVAVRQPGSMERFKVLAIHPIGAFRRAFIRTIEAEDLGGDF